MKRFLVLLGLSFFMGGLRGADSCFNVPSVTNVSSFVVEVTNMWAFTVSPTTLVENVKLEAPNFTNDVVNLVSTNLLDDSKSVATKSVAAPTKPPKSVATTNTVGVVSNALPKGAIQVVDTNTLQIVAEKAVNAAVLRMENIVATNEVAMKRRRVDTRTFKLKHASAEDVAERFNATWSGDFGLVWKVSKIAQAFPEANVVMVTAPGAILDACEKVIKEIDADAPQVYIEARFVELSNQAFHKLGIDWSMLNGMKGSLSLEANYNERKVKGVSEYNSDGTYTITPDSGSRSNANLSHVDATIGMSDLYIILNALEGSTDARVFSNPKIIVSSGHKATVDMTTKYPNVTVAVKRTINDGADSLDLDMKMAEIPGQDELMFAKEAFFSWGISLDVTPRVGTNGMINVEIVPTISDCSEFVTAGTSTDTSSYSSKYPIINVQRLVTEFNMQDNKTAVIGGLSRTVEEQVDTGIPWLRDWWWIGPKLFGGKTRQKTQKEIIVFVTVGLVNPENIQKDAGLPMNAVLGRQYTSGARLEPGQKHRGFQGVESLDLRPLEEQARSVNFTNEVVTVNALDKTVEQTETQTENVLTNRVNKTQPKIQPKTEPKLKVGSGEVKSVKGTVKRGKRPIKGRTVPTKSKALSTPASDKESKE